MNSFILQIASRYVKWLLLLFAVIALLRGHNLPGGGFIGGLLAGLSLVYEGLAFSAERARRNLRVSPEGYVATGLSCILLSVLPGVFTSGSIMEGRWITLFEVFGREIKMGSPLLFDVGIFFGVIGITLLFFFSLKQEGTWK